LVVGLTLAYYSEIERWLSKSVDSFPWLRSLAKKSYQYLNYLLARRIGFRCHMHSGAKLRTVVEWAGVRDDPVDRAEIFFGYYDKSPWSCDMRRILMHHIITGGQAEIIVFDRHLKDARVVARTSAWNYQQGSMAQWLPGSAGEKVIFNDVRANRLVARMVSVDGFEEVCSMPIQAVHPDGDKGLTLNYSRLHQVQPEYAYDVKVENFVASQSLDEDGIWSVEFDSGKTNLILSLSDLIKFRPDNGMKDSFHAINHIFYSTTGKRIAFLHRWKGKAGRFSRFFTVREDGTELQLISEGRRVSHYTWFNDEKILLWCGRYYLINVITGECEVVGKGALDPFGDGHPSFSPDRRWIVTDTYADRARERRLLLYELDSGRLMELGRFYAPWKFYGLNRCDLHPRWSPDGRAISIDSVHEGYRKSYVIELTDCVERV
jgi:hypothetical protein